MWTDTHSHLDFPDFAPDFSQVLERAAQAGVHRILTIGTTLEGSRRAVELAQSHPQIFAVVGIHPNHAHEVPANYLAELRSLASSPRVVALGEMGLDYHRLPSSLLPEPERLREAAVQRDAALCEAQARIFTDQLALAAELGLNVVVHERDAWEDTLALIAPFEGRLRCVFHCFGKSIRHARTLIDQNHLVSFTGILTFKNAASVQETARLLPRGSFMVETDCPFLAPVPHRGKRAEPAHAALVGSFLAHLRNKSPEEVARDTELAVQSFFRFSPHPSP
jgi:TatD DNase family protein